MGLGKKASTSSTIRMRLRFYSPIEIKATLVPISNSPEEREVVVAGASMHMLSEKVLSSDELETLRRSRNPTAVVTANGEVQANEDHKCTFTIFASS